MAVLQKGITTIRWGTKDGSGANPVIGGVTQSNLATAIVVSIKQERQGGPPIIIEDGNGFSVGWIGINDGQMFTLEVVDDTTVVFPAFGDTIKLTVIGDSAVKNFICEDTNADQARKKEGTRSIKARYYVNITVS